MAIDDHSWLLLLIDGHWMGWDGELTLTAMCVVSLRSDGVL